MAKSRMTQGEKANNNFFGNAVGIVMQLDELKVYLHEVNSFIKITHINLQSDKVKGLCFYLEFVLG